MSPEAFSAPWRAAADDGIDAIPSVVVVDPCFDRYASLASAARQGRLQLHMRSSAADAIKLTRRMHVDVWLIAAELDDMSGADFVELLGTRTGRARRAIVETADVGSSRWNETNREAAAAGADAMLAAPITLGDLERLLQVPETERDLLLLHESVSSRAFVALPVGVGAAIVAIAVVMLG